MCGVAGEEHVSFAHACRVVRLGPPVRDVQHLGHDVRRADRRLQQLVRALLGDPSLTLIASGRVTSSPTVLMTRKPVPPVRSSRKKPRSCGLWTYMTPWLRSCSSGAHPRGSRS